MNPGFRLTTVLIALLLIFSTLSYGQLLQTTKGTLPEPTPEEWRQWLENRHELHGCMHKSQKAIDGYKLSLMADGSTPTGNQYKYDVRYYKLDIELDFGSDQVNGYIESRIEALENGLDMVDFNLDTDYGTLSVSSVELDGSPVSFDHSENMLYIYLGQSFNAGQQFTLRVYYGGHPGFDGNHGLGFYYYGGNEVAYTNCEPFGARLWWPCKDFPYDKPDSLDMIVTHPATKVVASNGTLVSAVNNGDGTKTTHWHEKYPITTYLVSLGCTNYTLYSKNWQYAPGESMPIMNYSYPGISQYSQYYSLYYMRNYTIPSLEALSSYFTLYPFVDEKYGHNHYGWGGAMEHQTMTSISPGFNSEWVIAHELGHQWAGDLVTCGNFHHMWLNEGFASYSEALYVRYHYGEQTYKNYMQGMKHLDAGTPYVEDLVNDDMFDHTTVYDKGAWLVYMLHQILGDDDFLTAMDNYFNHPSLKYSVAYTSDLRQVCSAVYGEDMSWFFNNWVYNEGNPDYVYSWQTEESVDKAGYDFFLLIRQEQEYDLFPMPVDVQILGSGHDTTITVFNNQRGQGWEFNLLFEPTSVLLDPEEKILRTVEYDSTFGMAIIVPKQVDTAYIGQPYYAEYYTVGGVPDYSWSRASGQIPYGLTLHDSTVAYIEGTPTWASDFTFALEVIDSDDPPNVDSVPLTIVVLEGQQPDRPTMIAPSYGETLSDNRPLFVWSSTAGSGGSYTLQYSTSADFNTNVTTVEDIGDTTWQQSAPMANDVWYWHVEAFNQDEIGSGYQSTPFTFTVAGGQVYDRGDSNHNGNVDVSDAVFLINYSFAGGEAPDPIDLGDVNCDSSVDVSDAVYLINYAFAGGPAPCPW